MGRLSSGPFGFLNGKVGNMVSYALNGQNISRIAGKRTKPYSLKEKANFQRMRVTNVFLKTFVPFINITFASAVSGTMKNPYNEAVSFNKKFALTGDYPLISLDYSKALVSSGKLPPALAPVVSVLPAGLYFTWQTPADPSGLYQGNRAMILVFFPEGTDATGIPCAICEFSGARRSEGNDFLPLDPSQTGKPFQAYLAFIGEDRMQVSNSSYCLGDFI
ncbi:MAG TPA: DUF6266 family protein [Pedobacter sp.]|nr:DUF6266 family protein [Pedobacter sp.]